VRWTEHVVLMRDMRNSYKRLIPINLTFYRSVPRIQVQ